MTSPIVHINGTSADALVDGYMSAAEAVDAAIRAMYETSPHARDYYLIDGLYTKAIEEHASRVDRLRAVSDELKSLVVAVIESEEGRG